MTRQAEVTSNGQRFVFRWNYGDEGPLMDALSEMAQRPGSGFTWWDAAIVSHEVGQHLAQELKAYLPKKKA